MAIKLTDIDKLLKVTIDTLKSKKTLQKLGDETSERIVKRTRLGKGVMENLADAHPLPQLKDSTKKERKRLKKAGRLTGPRATPAKSGLNRTGEMLGDVKAKAQKGDLKIILNSAESKKKAEDLIKLNQGFTFLNISNAEFKGMLKSFSSILQKVIKQVIK